MTSSPTTFTLFFLAQFFLKLLDRKFFLRLVHPFLPFRLVAHRLLRSTVCRGFLSAFCGDFSC